MKKQFHYLKIFLATFIMISALSSTAQKKDRNVRIKDPKKTEETKPELIKLDQNEVIPKKRMSVAYDFTKVRICVDLVNNKSLPAKPVYVSPPQLPKIKSNGTLEYPSTINQGLTGETAKMWSPGDVITVGFATNETSAMVIGKVKQYAKQWEAIANIKFQFVDLSLAKVRVGFANDGTSWSWVGREVLTNVLNQKTVNFGWFDDMTSETEFRRVILHEFGHALGFVHEHQSSTANISWDKEKVYTFFSEPPNSWDRAKVDFNVFQKYSQSSTNSSVYDPSSIMHYFFSSDLTTNGVAMPGNTNFSTIDKQFARTVYPFPPTPANATGILHTGDDCDEIAFSVEYDVIDKNVIEFTLEPGRNQNNQIITSWKKIAVPVLGNAEVGLEMVGGSSTTKSIAAVILDKSKGIRFGKAKILEVHTGLGFEWPVLKALKGGCRVKLTWRRDKC